MKIIKLVMPNEENEFGKFTLEETPKIIYRFKLVNNIAKLESDCIIQPSYSPLPLHLKNKIEKELNNYLKTQSETISYQIYERKNINREKLAECRQLQFANLTFDGRGISRKQAIDEANTMLIVTTEPEGKVIGYAAVTTVAINLFNYFEESKDHRIYKNINPRSTYIDQILLTEEYRNRGIGKAMIGLLIHKFGKYIYLHVNNANKEAIKFYASIHFLPVGIYETVDMLSGKKYVSWLYEFDRSSTKIYHFVPD